LASNASRYNITPLGKQDVSRAMEVAARPVSIPAQGGYLGAQSTRHMQADLNGRHSSSGKLQQKASNASRRH
jgi:hypothetical protein